MFSVNQFSPRTFVDFFHKITNKRDTCIYFIISIHSWTIVITLHIYLNLRIKINRVNDLFYLGMCEVLLLLSLNLLKVTITYLMRFLLVSLVIECVFC